MIPRGPRDSLVLRGAWRVRAGDVIDGELSVERVGGDLYAPPATKAPMGVTELNARANVHANRLEAEGVMRGTRMGALRATLAASLERDPKPAGAWHRHARGASMRTQTCLRSNGSTRCFRTACAQMSVSAASSTASSRSLEHPPSRRQMATSKATRCVLRGSSKGAAGKRPSRRTRRRRRVRARMNCVSPGHRAFKPNDCAHGSVDGENGTRFYCRYGKLKTVRSERRDPDPGRALPLLQRVDRWVVATGRREHRTCAEARAIERRSCGGRRFRRFHASRPAEPLIRRDRVTTSSAPRERESPVQVGFDLGLDLGDKFYLRGSGLNTRVAGAVECAVKAGDSSAHPAHERGRRCV